MPLCICRLKLKFIGPPQYLEQVIRIDQSGKEVRGYHLRYRGHIYSMRAFWQWNSCTSSGSNTSLRLTERHYQTCTAYVYYYIFALFCYIYN